MELENARQRSLSDPQLGALFDVVGAVPDNALVKGMYVAGIWDALQVGGVSTARPRLHTFKDYPVTEYMELLVDAAITLFPDAPPAEGLRRLGRLAVPTFATSTVGGVLMGLVANRWSTALSWISKGYELSLNPGSAAVGESRPGHSVVQLRDVWIFGESYQVGVMEGLLTHCGLQGSVHAEVLGPASVDLTVTWRPARSVAPPAPGMRP